MSTGADAHCRLDMAAVRAQWPRPADGSTYLNTGTCGRKAQRVLAAITEGWQRFNCNPTLSTFYLEDDLQQARQAAADVLAIKADNLLLIQNSTQGLQMVLQSFLLEPDDEFVTTDHEHGSVRTLSTYLEETRGIVVRRLSMDASSGSNALCEGLLKLVSPKTQLVEVSEVDSFTGWRPNLKPLAMRLEQIGVPLLVDGAHAPGQGPSSAADYPMWVGSGHKWLGGPNGTGFLHVRPEYVERLKPSWLGDRYYNQFANPLMRFEFQGTSDVVRWPGLTAACRLALELGLDNIEQRQAHLVGYARRLLAELPSTRFRTPDTQGETTGILTVTWDADRIKVNDIKQWLWEQHRIWVQPDYYFGNPGHGMRLSCHIANEESEIDDLFNALRQVIA